MHMLSTNDVLHVACDRRGQTTRRAQLQQAALLMAPRTDEAVDHANAYSYIPAFIIHPHIMHGRSKAKTKTMTMRSLIGGVSQIWFAGVINWELSEAPGTMIPHRLSQKALVAVAHIIRRGLVILLIKELMKYLFSIFVSYLFVYFSTLACLQYFTPCVSPTH